MSALIAKSPDLLVSEFPDRSTSKFPNQPLPSSLTRRPLTSLTNPGLCSDLPVVSVSPDLPTASESPALPHWPPSNMLLRQSSIILFNYRHHVPHPFAVPDDRPFKFPAQPATQPFQFSGLPTATKPSGEKIRLEFSFGWSAVQAPAVFTGEAFLPKEEDEQGVNVSDTAVRILNSSLTTVFIPFIYIFIFVVGLPTNAMALWVFLFRTKKKHPASILMANLALADLLFIVWLPLKITYHFNGNDWTFGEPLCKVLVGFFYGNMYCSTIFIACISVQRYWTVVHPLSRKLSSRVTVCVCVCVWVVFWLLTVPLYLYDQTVKILNLNTTTCHDVNRRNETHFPVGYFLTMGTVGYGVPCVVCIVSYLLTFRSLRRSVIDASSNKKKRKAIVLMVTVLVMFLVCFTPSNIMLMVHYSLLGVEDQNDVYSIYMVALCLGSLNSCLDPFVYYYISEEFRDHVKNSLMCRSERTSKQMKVISRPLKVTGEIPMPNTTTSTVEHPIEDSLNAA
ncbi:hypothetical protein AOLI_G00202360 [Acnodon oligacanthus]